MDSNIQGKLDTLVEQEFVQGYRILEVPHSVQKALNDARQLDPAIPHFNKLRIAKLTPRKRSLVSEAVLARYHNDLKNKNILSKSAIRDLNIERGEWSKDKDKRIKELQETTGKLLYELNLEGIDKEQEWREQLAQACARYTTALADSDKHPDEKDYLATIFWRWVNYTKDALPEYTEKYAQSQGLDNYSVDWDLSKLYATAPTTESAEDLATIDEIQLKLERYIQLFKDRKELMQLLADEARMYAESVESRRDQAEEMARMYYGLVALDDTGSVVGPVTASLDAFWDLPEDFIGWLLEECYFFYNAIPHSIREHLDDWGFTIAGRENGLLRLLEGSPVPQDSSNATEPAEEMASSSSV